MRITVFVGAGAAIEIGGPSTNIITTKTRAQKQEYRNNEIGFIDQIGKTLDAYFNESCNFEEIFHTLELLSSYKIGWDGANKKYTPYLSLFTKPRLSRFFKNSIIINIAKEDLIKTVADLVDIYDRDYLPTPNQDWHNVFWKKVEEKFKLDIATLNYDTCIEQVLPNLEDGFEKTLSTLERFSPKKLIHSKESKIYHLHGCIHYGYARPANPNEYTLEDDFEDIYKHPNYLEASKTWFGRSKNVSQASEEAIIGPIITGMRKTDKVIGFPYSTYNTAFHTAILSNRSLLIIGYSFGDLHLNNLLGRVRRLHGNESRIVLVTKFTGEIWHRDPGVMDWPTHEMLVFISKAFHEYEPFSSLIYSSPLISKDGNTRIYLNGFKEATENHSDEILTFLNS